MNVAKDPVCRMSVLQEGSLKVQYGGHDVYFCSALCKARFEQEPAKRLLKETGQHGCLGLTVMAAVEGCSLSRKKC